MLQILEESAEPMKSEEIAEAVQIDKKAVDKAMNVLKVNGPIVSPEFCYRTRA